METVSGGKLEGTGGGPRHAFFENRNLLLSCDAPADVSAKSGRASEMQQLFMIRLAFPINYAHDVARTSCRVNLVGQCWG